MRGRVILSTSLPPTAAPGEGGVESRVEDQARVWTFDPEEVIDDARCRVQAAVERRGMLPELRGQDGLRLIHGGVRRSAGGDC